MHHIILGLLFLLSGFFMKLSDDYSDINKDLKLASLTGILCAIASFLATVYDVDAACILIGILIGNFLVLKVDGIHHILTLILYLLLCIIFGIPQLSIVVLLICVLSALSDEVGHELISNVTKNSYIVLFFEYRFVMKVVILLLAIFGVFNILTFLCFILFEIAYELAGFISEKLN